MAPGQKPRDQKIAETLEAIKGCGWRSTNQFIEAFYGEYPNICSVTLSKVCLGTRRGHVCKVVEVPVGEEFLGVFFRWRGVLNGLGTWCGVTGVFSGIRGRLFGVDGLYAAFSMLMRIAFCRVHSNGFCLFFCHAISPATKILKITI
jgi:hypothetical protein